jgi:glyoxylase I family protein
VIFKNVNHVAVIVSNLEVSWDFYINKLGFTLIHELDRPERQSTILYLDAGNCIIELFSFPAPPKRLARPEACGLRHLAFTVDDFDSTIEKLNGMNIPTEPVRVDARTGKKMTFFKDPDDLPLEICEA